MEPGSLNPSLRFWGFRERDLASEQGYLRGLSLPASCVPPPLPPLSDRIYALASSPSKGLRTALAKKISHGTAWEAARLGALFSAIYNQGVVSGTDTEKIEAILQKIIEMERNAASRLNKKERDIALDQLTRAKECTLEVMQFGKKSATLRKIEEDFEKAIAKFNESIYGAVLLALPDITLPLYSVSVTLRKYRTEIAELPEGALKFKTSWDFAQKKRLFSFSVDQLYESLSVEVEKAIRYLKQRQNANPADLDTARGFHDLHYVLQNGQILISRQKTEESDIDTDIDRITHYLRGRANHLDRAILSKIARDEESPLDVEYENLPWRRNYRNPQVKGLLERAVSQLNPENWSDTTKNIVLRLVAAAQLSAQGVQMIQNFSSLKRRADEMQNQVIKAVPSGQAEQIERETSHIGTLLADKYQHLNVTPFTQGRSPAFRDALLQAQMQFGADQPTNAQIFAFMNAFRTKEMVKASPMGNPLQQIKLMEWWNIFNTDWEAANHEVRSAEPSVEPVPSDMPGLMKLMSSIAQQPAQGQSLVEAQINAGTLLLVSALADLGKLLVPNHIQHDDKLSEDIALFKRELQSISRPPPKDCSLVEIATWIQHVEDLSHGIAQKNWELTFQSENPSITSIITFSSLINSKKLSQDFALALLLKLFSTDNEVKQTAGFEIVVRIEDPLFKEKLKGTLRTVIVQSLDVSSLSQQRAGLNLLSGLLSRDRGWIPLAEEIIRSRLSFANLRIELYKPLLKLISTWQRITTRYSPPEENYEELRDLGDERIKKGLFASDLKTRLQASYLLRLVSQGDFVFVLDMRQTSHALEQAGRDIWTDCESLAEAGIKDPDPITRYHALYLAHAALWRLDVESWIPMGKAILQKGAEDPQPMVREKALELLSKVK